MSTMSEREKKTNQRKAKDQNEYFTRWCKKKYRTVRDKRLIQDGDNKKMMWTILNISDKDKHELLMQFNQGNFGFSNHRNQKIWSDNWKYTSLRFSQCFTILVYSSGIQWSDSPCIKRTKKKGNRKGVMRVVWKQQTTIKWKHYKCPVNIAYQLQCTISTVSLFLSIAPFCYCSELDLSCFRCNYHSTY